MRTPFFPQGEGVIALEFVTRLPHPLAKLIMDLVNHTPYRTWCGIVSDAKGAENLLVVVKGTWSIKPDGALVLAEEQVPIVMTPIYHGAPGASTLLSDSELVLEKPGTDCILLGNARTPKACLRSVDVSFGVGSMCKTIRVFGERIWMKWLWTVAMSRPVPFESIPLLWERTFGGADTSAPDPSDHEYFPENPVGRGMRARSSRLPIDGMRLPNLEAPDQLIRSPSDRPRPVCFAPIPAHWAPRSQYAVLGHGDADSPSCHIARRDLHPLFHASAAPGLTSPGHLLGNEMVLVQNATRQGRLCFPLPGVGPRVAVSSARREEDLVMLLDTVIVEPDEERVALVWRGKRPVPTRVQEVGKVTVRLHRL